MKILECKDPALMKTTTEIIKEKLYRCNDENSRWTNNSRHWNK